MENLLYILILFPIVTGITIYLLPYKTKVTTSIAVQVIQLSLSVACFMATRETPIVFNIGEWLPPVGISIYADRISSSFVLLTSLLFLCFVIYNSKRHYADRMFFMLYLILQGMLTALFLMDDLFSIFVISEVSTMVVSLLIMYKRDSRSMYDGLIYLLVNIFSMTFYLFGLAFLYKQLGTFSMRYIYEIVQDMNNVEVLYLPYALILTSICLKAALMPLFSWLPKAHGTPSAPSVVSAVLSGIYVKGGIYLYFRISSAFSVIDTSEFFLVCGIITAIVGFTLAIAQTDIKLILSYHTVSQLGLIMLALNMGNQDAMYGGIYHILSHALFKSVLFLCAGVIIEKYETRNVYEIKGLFKSMPAVAIACICAILGITGAPLFNGSISKYLISHGAETFIMEVLLIIINLGTLLSFVKFFSIFGHGKNIERMEVVLNRKIILLVLGGLCLFGGLFGAQAIKTLYGVSIHIEPDGYLIKSLTYAGTLVAAYLLYKIGFTKLKLFKRIRDFDAGFNTIALTIPAFFCTLFVYLLVF